MYSALKEFKAGELACYAGLPLNTNPHLHKRNIISQLKALAWKKGFKYAETQAKGV